MPETLTFPIRSDKLTMSVQVKSHLLHEQSAFQTIDFYDTEAFGKMLFLDGHVQLAELDEHVYHECLVHIPLFNVVEPRQALIVGGGDGGVLRELLKWPLERVDMVEIDEHVIAASKRAWPELSAGAFEDPRANVMIQDAFEFVKTCRETYNLVVMDSTDVYEEEDASLSQMLFTREFYADLLRLLSDDGFVVTQADNLVFCPYSLLAIQQEFGAVFARTGSYHAVIPSFGGYSGYCWASRGAEVSPTLPKGAGVEGLRFLNQARYAAAFEALPFPALG
ncbi:MAG: hypothetical protein HZC36_10800 [Armatimonadetes bacterium]|nr:hypothetical protein [Armatimonadota bacterium]